MGIENFACRLITSTGAHATTKRVQPPIEVYNRVGRKTEYSLSRRLLSVPEEQNNYLTTSYYSPLTVSLHI